eukprot:6202496-Pleurochrysis_carterae.AAC.2
MLPQSYEQERRPCLEQLIDGFELSSSTTSQAICAGRCSLQYGHLIKIGGCTGDMMLLILHDAADTTVQTYGTMQVSLP